MIRQKQILGILGACFAVGGGITIAGIIVWKLNKMKKRSKKR